ncbi:MAG: transglutaminase-like domain-containing protein [Aquificaceae bacterium]
MKFYRLYQLLVVLCSLLLPVFVFAASKQAGYVTLEVDLSNQEKGHEAKLWVPYPISDKYQLVTDIKVSGDYSQMAVYTDQANSTPILYAEWPKDAHSRKLTLSFFVERNEIEQRNLPDDKGISFNPKEFEEYLKPNKFGPIDGEVKKLANEITKDKTTVLSKARAIYDWVCQNSFRDPNTVGCGKGDVCVLLKRPGGKCTDISSIFIALCKAAGIPAREVFGIRLGKKTEEDITTYQHCWAEFYLPGYGWVTVDPADVRKAMLVEKLEWNSPKTKEYVEYFWGGADAYRVVIAKGRDIVLNPKQAGESLNTFGYPYAEIGGKPLDFYSPKDFVYKYTFNTVK